MASMYKHVFFDLDDTLTPSRTLMMAEHQPLFEKLCRAKDVIVVSGAQRSQMIDQIPEKFNGLYYMLCQQGNYAVDKDGSLLWNDVLNDRDTALVNAFIEMVKAEVALKVVDENDLVEHRGAQISYSLIGQHEKLEKKRAFDPAGAKRKKILADHEKDVQQLLKDGIEVTVGGTTNFDFFHTGHNKGYNVKQLCDMKGWAKDESLYVGDALEPGRNDETVIGVIPTHAIKDHNETYEYIKKELLK